MANITTLIPDIYEMLQSGTPAVPQTPEMWGKYAWQLAKHSHEKLVRKPFPRPEKTLYVSELGEKCLRKLWFKIHTPGHAEPLSGHAHIKFTYGNMIEQLVLQYARNAGHEVTCEQELVEGEYKGWKIRGRIDAVIDGVTVDVKSTSTYAFDKYTRDGITAANDDFGYLRQLGYYADKKGTTGAFILVNKQTGRLSFEVPYALDTTTYPDVACLESKLVPDRGYPDKEQMSGAGKYKKPTGNRVLGVACSYCDFKERCWPKLRAFNYSHGPVFMTEVKKVPSVTEIPLRVAPSLVVPTSGVILP